MANPTTANNGLSVPSTSEEMRIPFALSALVHVALILFAIFGLHLLPKHPLDTPPPIAISMVNPTDMTRTNHIDTPHEEKEPTEPVQSKAPEPPKEGMSSPPPPTPEPPKEQPKVETPPPPPPPPPAPPEKPLQKLEPVPKAETSFQQPAELPKLQKPAKIVPPQPAPPKPDQQKAKQIDQDFDSLLKNLTPVQKADQISKDKPVKGHQQASAIAPLGEKLSADELALIRDRVNQCWVPVNEIAVEINAQYNENKTLAAGPIGIVDPDDRYDHDPAFRAQADSAVRALRNPQCNPLPWPDGKYSLWSHADMNFDPKLMGK